MVLKSEAYLLVNDNKKILYNRVKCYSNQRKSHSNSNIFCAGSTM